MWQMEQSILSTIPLANLSDLNLPSTAEAAYCAGDQGKFWEMHDIILSNQSWRKSGRFYRQSFDAVC